MLSEQERKRVQEAIRSYGYLSRRDVDRLRDRADEELPYELIARAVVEDPSAKVRWQSVVLLDHYADHHYIDALIVAATDRVPRVRVHAVHALGCVTCSREATCVDVIPVLADRAVNDDSAKVRRHATWGLLVRQRDIRAVATLTQLAERDPDPRVRHDAARVVVC